MCRWKHNELNGCVVSHFVSDKFNISSQSAIRHSETGGQVRRCPMASLRPTVIEYVFLIYCWRLAVSEIKNYLLTYPCLSRALNIFQIWGIKIAERVNAMIELFLPGRFVALRPLTVESRWERGHPIPPVMGFRGCYPQKMCLILLCCR